MEVKSSIYLGLISLGLVLLAISCGETQQESNEQKSKSAYLRDELSSQHGLTLFNEHCASCHNFQEAEIGPNLSGVTKARDKEWLMSFIENSPKMLAEEDPIAVELFEKYKLPMPSFPMLDSMDLEYLLAFINKFSRTASREVKARPGEIINPIKAKIESSNLVLSIEEFVKIPSSAENVPVARINKLDAIRTGSSQRMFVHDLRGVLYEITDAEVDTFLNLREYIPAFIDRPGYGTGFGSFTFHPDYMQNGLLYTTHTEPPHSAKADFALPEGMKVGLQYVIVEWRADDPSKGSFAGQFREVLRADMYSTAHGFQDLTFNPLSQKDAADYGLLYLGVGDGSLALRANQLLCDGHDDFWSSVIRIDPAGNNSENGQYGIPPNNPFADGEDGLGEVWASGFRNPHRITWDESGSGKMFITNIGQHSLEEINLGIAGAHYGWPYREGTFLFDVDANREFVYPLPDDDAGYMYPVVQYDHDEGNAVSGGFVCWDPTLPELHGKHIFGDIPRGTIWYSEVNEMEVGQQAKIFSMALEYHGKKTDLATLCGNSRVDLRLGIDRFGSLYVLTKSNGYVYKVVGCRSSEAL